VGLCASVFGGGRRGLLDEWGFCGIDGGESSVGGSLCIGVESSRWVTTRASISRSLGVFSLEGSPLDSVFSSSHLDFRAGHARDVWVGYLGEGEFGASTYCGLEVPETSWCPSSLRTMSPFSFRSKYSVSPLRRYEYNSDPES
jgi:hypothetical protein